MGELLQRDGWKIMERWFQRADAEQVHASQKDRKEVMNDLHDMLKVIGLRLCAQSPEAFTEAIEIARDHGQQRAHFGWNIVNLVKDYEILHGVVLEHLGETMKERLTYRQSAVLVAILDRAIGSAVEAFNEMTEARLEAANTKLEKQVARQKRELRELVLRLAKAEHQERQRIAQTLHDDFQQILVATRMKLQAGMQDVSPAVPALKEAASFLDHMLTVSRQLSADLYPAVLDAQPFPAAIQWLAELFQQRYNLVVTVDLQVPPESTLETVSLRKMVYDAVRELLFNIVKHAETNQAWVRINNEGDKTWTFEIEDRGIGFTESDIGNRAPGDTSLGIESVVDRIQKIGGTIDFESRPGHGTKVLFTVPLAL